MCVGESVCVCTTHSDIEAVLIQTVEPIAVLDKYIFRLAN